MVLEILGVLFVWSWPIWSFVFIFSLFRAIKKAVQAPDDIEKKPRPVARCMGFGISECDFGRNGFL